MKLIAQVAGGQAQFSDFQKQLINQEFARLDGQNAVLEITKEKRARTIRQNSYLWSVVYAMIAAESGHSTEEIHSFCKLTFLPRSFIKVGETEQEIDKSTTELSTDEFSKYVEQIRAFAADQLNLTIPDPQL